MSAPNPLRFPFPLLHSLESKASNNAQRERRGGRGRRRLFKEVGGEGFDKEWKKDFFTHFPLDLEEEYKYSTVLNERFSLKGEETLGALEI